MSDLLTSHWKQEGQFTLVTHEGRTGWRAQGIHDRLLLEDHTLNKPQGTLTFWFCPLDDLGVWSAGMDLPAAEPDFGFYSLLTDSDTPRQRGSGTFTLSWDSGWYPSLIAQFFPGHLYSNASDGEAYVLAGHIAFERLRWVCLQLTWNDETGEIHLVANGVLVSRNNPYSTRKTRHRCGEILRAGNPSLLIGDILFEDKVLPPIDLPADPQTRKWQRMLSPASLPTLDWQPPAGWRTELNLSLREPEHIDAFYVQGMEEAPRITPDGLEVRTALERRKGNFGAVTAADPAKRAEDKDQVYLWTRQHFASRRLAVELEFMPRRHNGLSLLVLQASGMQGEDFMAEYPLRTNGWMKTVYGENVRNYHWEFFREMDDCRADVASHVLCKNPWGWPLQYQCAPEPLELDRWHRLLFLQEENRLRGVIDGQVVLDVQDNPHNGHGPIYRQGHFAIRCMWKSHFLYRNLNIHLDPEHAL
jgi:hypothetical protein